MSNHSREARIMNQLVGPIFLDAITSAAGFIAGGAVRSVFSSDHVSDIDIFFESRDSFNKCVQALGEGVPFTKTESAWTHISNGGHSGVPKMRYQLICAEFGNINQILAKFDFTNCMGAYDPGARQFAMDQYFLKHVAQKRLCFNANALYPICSLWRAAKFIKRGWRLPGIEAIKLALAVNNIGIKDFADLRKQLLGIDTMFLEEMMAAMAQKAEARYDFGEAIDFICGFLDEEE